MMALLHAAHDVEQRMEAALADHGLSLAKLGGLNHLVSATQPLTLGELAERSRCVRSNVTQLVDRLEADGLVRRIQDSADRRIVRAELTAKGRELQALGDRTVRGIEAEVMRGLGQARADALRDALGAFG